jgi:nicotinamidase-related amidase
VLIEAIRLSSSRHARAPNHRKASIVTVTVLDPRVALVVIDLQKGIVSFPTVHPIAEIEAFRRQSLPVVLVNVDAVARGRTEQAIRVGELPAGWTDLVPELNQQPQDHLVTKRTWGAFTNTGLEAHLKSLGITQVVITGVATCAGVESTARHAHELGFNVVLAADAMTDMNADAHHNSLARIFPRLGETGTTEEIIDLLGKRNA